MNYGLPYQGSKSRVAPWVVKHLPKAHTLIELFAGGCAVTHCAMLQGKYKHYIINDVSDSVNIFMDAVNGKFENFTTVLTKQEFIETDDDAMKITHSFGYNRRDYLWRDEVEKVKVPIAKMILAKSPRERRLYYMQFINALDEYIKEGKDVEKLRRLECLECLERIQKLSDLKSENVESSQLDYKEVEIPENSIVYADPPYKDVNVVGYQPFDYDEFDNWIHEVKHPIIISEYRTPKGCVEIASKVKDVTMSANGKGHKATERLFIQEEYLDWYNNKMQEERLF